MLQYLDSSFLLSLILGDANTPQARETWIQAGHRFSSLLLKIETLTVVRRVYAVHHATLPEKWLAMKEGALRSLWESVHFRNLDQEIFSILETHRSLSKCRSLDAIHLATALELSPLGGPVDTLVVCSYDKKMIRLARELGLEVLPPFDDEASR
jgi:predicted nucleic acid-binding protein